MRSRRSKSVRPLAFQKNRKSARCKQHPLHIVNADNRLHRCIGSVITAARAGSVGALSIQHSCCIVSAVCPAVPTVPDYFLGLSFFSNRDHLDTHRHCELAVLTMDTFSEIYLFGDVAVFYWYFSHKLTHHAPPEQPFISDKIFKHCPTTC